LAPSSGEKLPGCFLSLRGGGKKRRRKDRFLPSSFFFFSQFSPFSWLGQVLPFFPLFSLVIDRRGNGLLFFLSPLLIGHFLSLLFPSTTRSGVRERRVFFSLCRHTGRVTLSSSSRLQSDGQRLRGGGDPSFFFFLFSSLPPAPSAYEEFSNGRFFFFLFFFLPNYTKATNDRDQGSGARPFFFSPTEFSFFPHPGAQMIILPFLLSFFPPS